MSHQQKNHNPLPGDSSKQRVAVLLEYNGTAFHGSQYQPNHRTVQGELMGALNRLGIEFSAMMLAGRTDAGVHAKGQVVHFDVPQSAFDQIENLLFALHFQLPPDISIRDIRFPVEPHFHSQRQAEYKWYRYKLYLGSTRSVWMPPDAAYIKNCYLPHAVSTLASHPRILDLNRLNAAARLIEGQHSFKSFQCGRTDLQSDVCAIMKARFSLEAPSNHDTVGNILVFDIVGDRFLYKMVRSLVGQLLVIGQADPKRFGDPEEWLDPAYILHVISQKDRTKATHVAPAGGLSLMNVVYPGVVDYFSNDPLRKTLSTLLSQDNNAYQDPVLTDSSSASKLDETTVSNDLHMELNPNENLFCKAS